MKFRIKMLTNSYKYNQIMKNKSIKQVTHTKYLTILQSRHSVKIQGINNKTYKKNIWKLESKRNKVK